MGSRPGLFHRSKVGVAVFALLASLGSAAEEGPETRATNLVATSLHSTNNPLKQLGHELFELGKVRFDKRQRSVSFPAFVNMREGNLEYLLVTSSGKIHERTWNRITCT
jgi:hypothetical protein